MNLFSLEGQVPIVNGASRGLEEAIAVPAHTATFGKVDVLVNNAVAATKPGRMGAPPALRQPRG